MPNILIVDDSEMWRRMSKDALARYGHSIREADSGESAVASAHTAPVDLVVMDYGMPSLNGIEASRLLRQVPGCELVPIILLTAEDFPGDCNETPLPFVSGYVDKKRIFTDLADCVGQHLDGVSAAV
ncbi:MAG TPA: response regulator [Pyrinomonadaceae bacterium]|nr:response regulator [Pyrinomonadaceae bacterium]